MTSRPSGFHLTKAGRLRLYSTQELLRLPRPEWLIDGMIPAGGVVGVYAQPGVGKSFLAIDLALCVATGLPWQGRAVRPGYVIYIAAEGGVGVTKRVGAWLSHYGVDSDSPEIAWLMETISVNNDADDLDTLFMRIDHEVDREPALIVIDTLARCFDGDENAQEDMGRFIQGVDRMRVAYGATVMIIHHTNVGGTRERGNTAFRGAADTMIAMGQEKGIITISCDKQKDDAEFEPMDMQLHLIPEWESAVLLPATQSREARIVSWLKIGPLSYTDMKLRAKEQHAMSESSFKRAIRELLALKRIRKNTEENYELCEISDEVGVSD